MNEQHVATSPHSDGKGCKTLFVEKDVCTIYFLTPPSTDKEARTPSPEGGVVVKLETIRGETLFLNLNKKQEIMSIDLFQPGVKPCQPQWGHVMEEVAIAKEEEKETKQ